MFVDDRGAAPFDAGHERTAPARHAGKLIIIEIMGAGDEKRVATGFVERAVDDCAEQLLPGGLVESPAGELIAEQSRSGGAETGGRGWGLGRLVARSLITQVRDDCIKQSDSAGGQIAVVHDLHHVERGGIGGARARKAAADVIG